jgi:cytochrome c biogenesis protein CcdA
MTLLLISFIAGVLTVLAPCILPLLPVVIGSGVSGRSQATPFIVIGSLVISILLFTYLLKASTLLIDIPPFVWSYLSGIILTGFGLILLFPQLWERLPLIAKSSVEANKLVGAGHQKKSVWGDIMVGAALGPVFSACSPTYFVILATVLPASFFLGTTYLLAYLTGLALVLGLIALLGQRLTARLQFAASSRSWLKQAAGLLFIVVGVSVMSGFDKKLEAKILDAGFFDITKVEERLLNQLEATPPMNNETTNMKPSIDVPRQLERLFPDTDWSQADPALEQAISGGPTKDGIPALENPTLVPLGSVTTPDSVQAIVLTDGDNVRVYPYNILTWHEIVNDTVADTPVAITFCPLCGSAIVFDRTLPDGTISTFGVSGSLLESNMIMYDRATESLWQQSTGRALAGTHFDHTLSLVGFQLLTLGEVRRLHPQASIMSEQTGHNRDYTRNPYSGYETNNQFVFEPSHLDTTLPPKTIVAVFRAGETPVATPWLALRETGQTSVTINDEQYRLTIVDGELIISTSSGETLPFYFEMWFSFATQHGERSHLVTP